MKKAYYGLLTFAIMSLFYDLYYWNMRSAVGVLRAEDKALCLSSGIVCVLMIAFVIIKSIKNRKQTDLKNGIDNEEKFVKHSDS